jgi:hypothetical protein
MRPEQAFPGKRVVKIKGHGKGRTGLITETNLLGAGRIFILWDDTLLSEWVNPAEFDHEHTTKSVTS